MPELLAIRGAEEKLIVDKLKAVEIMLDPKSIAVIGASEDPEKLGCRLLRSLYRCGCKRSLYRAR